MGYPIPVSDFLMAPGLVGIHYRSAPLHLMSIEEALDAE